MRLIFKEERKLRGYNFLILLTETGKRGKIVPGKNVADNDENNSDNIEEEEWICEFCGIPYDEDDTNR